eukprot:gnl/TRDRNA2_/TRDRNA2_167258_c1_seq1.p1 gnl/TRDRNA2_/TRDRNA2_167258_c1~~gnl/TRDRNA2_/TRDRNA2_167258_c1_seq1.p1  ORF type:complete len:336 (-),score=36.73 gnl/TRDRNA2_/TRDRNA2_167258_c1_seq1:130-1137(-)
MHSCSVCQRTASSRIGGTAGIAFRMNVALDRAFPRFVAPSLARSFTGERHATNTVELHRSQSPMHIKSIPDVAHFHRRPRKGDDQLDLTHLITQSIWSKEELSAVQQTHRGPQGITDKAAYTSIRALRFGFDLFSGYWFKSRTRTMAEADWLQRILFLETLAGVPGMVGGMVRHLHSLRLMRRDHGWIHSLLAEAENERMHLLIALKLRKPGPLFRWAVVAGQGVFLSFYSLAYLLCPRYCHRFVGYLEEEAVTTYSHLLQEIDAGNLPTFAQTPAPVFARTYYNLPNTAMLRDVFECIRADESHHRDANHQFGDLKPDEPNPQVERLRQIHYTK